MPGISNYEALTNHQLADILETIGIGEGFEHRGILFLEAARRLRSMPEVEHNDGVNVRRQDTLSPFGDTPPTSPFGDTP